MGPETSVVVLLPQLKCGPGPVFNGAVETGADTITPPGSLISYRGPFGEPFGPKNVVPESPSRKIIRADRVVLLILVAVAVNVATPVPPVSGFQPLTSVGPVNATFTQANAGGAKRTAAPNIKLSLTNLMANLSRF